MPNVPIVNVVGGGLAGVELAYQLSQRKIRVRLFEMRPVSSTPAHCTGNLAELVCSNSFKSKLPSSAPGIFKKELELLGSFVLKKAELAQVPAGEALAVDREVFSKLIEQDLLGTGYVEKITKRVEDLDALPEAFCTVVATGPLTQGGLAKNLQSYTENEGLYFYDAIAPVISADSIDRSIVFAASRYGKGGDDYLNCPFSKEEYEVFYKALMDADKMAFQDFEEAKYFQGCQPIEAIAETGVDSLRFGPMKPVGLTDPRTGKRPYANVQLRLENLNRSAYNLVGFQTKLKYPEQKRVFSLIPGLKEAEFLRLGSMHRNTYICTPKLLNKNFSAINKRQIRFAGQITGVEGYIESSSIGLLVSIAILRELSGKPFELPPSDTILGGLCRYLFETRPSEFQPMNVNFSLVTLGERKKNQSKQEQRELFGRKSLEKMTIWRGEYLT
ncbi:MAG: methylenetetrahydrofolate--tRNA-(uracil(54)-C(5))-methyltransferase (FADH(2)-oxidizing) TrmFO [Bacteriovoracia bacterium]